MIKKQRLVAPAAFTALAAGTIVRRARRHRNGSEEVRGLQRFGRRLRK